MELFIKRFIDLLDEMVPVSMVHTLVEQPLGAVMHDYYIKIHARMDLLDEDSPYAEIELYPFEQNRIEILYAYSYPRKSIHIPENDFINRLKENEWVRADKIIPVTDEENYYFEVFFEEELHVTEHHGAMDELIHQKVPEIKQWLSIGGYPDSKEDSE